MSYNRKAIADALSKMNKAKKPKQPKDIIKDPEGQYKYPGVPTRIPSDNITMQGVSYPLLGVDNLGNQQMMYPGAEYIFPGADYVDEFPMMQKAQRGQNVRYTDNPNDLKVDSGNTTASNNNSYKQKHPDIYVSDPNDPRIGMYTEAGNLIVYKKHHVSNLDTDLSSWLKTQGAPTSYAERNRLYQQVTGRTDYKGTAQQNIDLLNLLKEDGLDYKFNAETNLNVTSQLPPLNVAPIDTPVPAISTNIYKPTPVGTGDFITYSELQQNYPEIHEKVKTNWQKDPNHIPFDEVVEIKSWNTTPSAENNRQPYTGDKTWEELNQWCPECLLTRGSHYERDENGNIYEVKNPVRFPLDFWEKLYDENYNIDDFISIDTSSPQGSQQPSNTPQQAPVVPQQPSGYNVWKHNGQPLDPSVYGWAPSDSPRQISQFADTHSLERANKAYTKLNATPWATQGNKLLTDLSKPYFTKAAATNAMTQTAEQLGVPVEQLEIVKAPAGYSGYIIIQTLPQQKYGGLVTGLTNTSGNLLMNEQGKRMMAQSGSLSATNKMFLGNPMVTKRKKSVFVPGAPFQEGGSTDWRTRIASTLKFQQGGQPSPEEFAKRKAAYEKMTGRQVPAIKQTKIVSPPPVALSVETPKKISTGYSGFRDEGALMYNPVEITTTVKDQWNRPRETSAWYGFDPDKKEFTSKDKWGRNPGDEKYGYDENREVWTLGSKGDKRININKPYVFDDKQLIEINTNSDAKECLRDSEGNCLQSAFSYYDKYVAPNLGLPNSWKIKENANLSSGLNHNRYKQVGESWDSWELAGGLLEKGGKLFFTSKNNISLSSQLKKKTPEEQEKYWLDLNVPIGTIINGGFSGRNKNDGKITYNESLGLAPSNHSAVVIGHDKKGIPVIFDYGKIYRITDPTATINKDSQGINNIIAPKEVLEMTYDKIKNNKSIILTTSVKPLSKKLIRESIFENARTANNNKTKVYLKDHSVTPDIKSNLKEMYRFGDLLVDNKEKYIKNFNLPNDVYDEYVRRAIALAFVETGGGDETSVRVKLGIPLPSYKLKKMGIGNSFGLTQINTNILWGDSKITKQLNNLGITEDNYDPWKLEHITAATIAMLKNTDNVAKTNVKKFSGNNTDMHPAMVNWYQWNRPETFVKGTAQGDAIAGKKFMNYYNAVKFQEGGNIDDPGMDAMMKARFAYAHMHGNPAAQRMTYPVDNPYIFTGTEPYTTPDMAGSHGTHYMFSEDNYAVPAIQQDEYGNLIYNPEANYTNPEAIQCDRPEDAEYFAECYKDIAPGMQTGGSTDWKSRVASAMNFQKGGQLSKEEFEKRKAAYKKMTGRDFEPPKSFKPTQQSREYYQNRANQQPVVQTQPSETTQQSRKMSANEVEQLKVQNAPTDPRINRYAFEADTRSNAQRERDQFYANQLTDPNIYNQIGNFLDAGIAQAGNFWDYVSGGDDWEKELENYKLQRLNPYVSDKDKLKAFVNFGLSNTGNALMTGMEIADGYALARAIPGIQSQVGKYLTQGPLKNAYKINPLANRTPYGGRIHSSFGSEEAHWLTGHPSKETIHARMMKSRPIQLNVPAEPSNFSFIDKKGNLFSPFETSPLKGKLQMSSSENVLSKQNFWNKSEIDAYIKQQQTKNKMWDDLYKEYESIDPTGKKTPNELNDLFPHLKEKSEAIKNYSSINLDEKFLMADLKEYLGKNLDQYINNTGTVRNTLNRGHLLDIVGTLNATDFLHLSLYPSSINIGNKTLKFPNQQFLIDTWEKGRLNQYGGIVTPPAMLGAASQYQQGGQMSREEFEKRKAAYKKLTGRDLTEKNVATIKQQQNLQKFIDDKKPLEKKLPTSEAEAMAMIESGELKIETIAQQQAREKREADAREADRIARLKAYEKRQADPNYGAGLTPLPGETWRDFWAAEGSNLDAVFRTSQEDNFFDDYINPLVWIGSMAKNLGESPQQAKQTGSLLPYITAVGTPLVMGAIAGAGATNTGQFVNNLVNPVAGLGTGLLNRAGRRSFTPYLDDIGSSLNPRVASNTPRQLPGSSNAALPPNTRPQLNVRQQQNAELLSEWVNNRGMTGEQLLNFSQRDPDWLRIVEDYVSVTGDRQGINAFLAGGNRRIPTYRSNTNEDLLELSLLYDLDTQPIQNIINTESINLSRLRPSSPVIFDLLERAPGEGISLGSANRLTFNNITSSLVKKPAQKLQNLLINLDKKMGSFLEKNRSTAKKPISITDIEKEVNMLLEKGVGVKKAKNVKIKLKAVPNSSFGEARIFIDIKDYFKNNKKLLQDAYPDSDIDAWIESVHDGYINSGTIQVSSTINSAAQTRRFTDMVRGRPKETGYTHSGLSTPIETPGLRKKGEFPFSNWDPSVKDNILNNLGLSGEYNKALNEVLKSKGYGLYSGGTGHLSDGAKRYVREFLKNRVNIINPEKAKIFLDQLRDPEIMRLIDNALKNKNQALPPEVYSAIQNVIFKYKKKGGSIQPLDYFDTELTDQEIEQYKKGGCVIVKL